MILLGGPHQLLCRPYYEPLLWFMTRRQVTTTMNGNMQHCSIQLQKEVKSNPAIKKVCGLQEGHYEKRCEIQGGGQEWLCQ